LSIMSRQDLGVVLFDLRRLALLLTLREMEEADVAGVGIRLRFSPRFRPAADAVPRACVRGCAQTGV